MAAPSPLRPAIATASRSRGGDNAFRYARAPSRRDAHSRRSTDRQCGRQGRRDSDRHAARSRPTAHRLPPASAASSQCARAGNRAHRPAAHRSDRSPCRCRNACRSAGSSPHRRVAESKVAQRRSLFSCPSEIHGQTAVAKQDDKRFNAEFAAYSLSFAETTRRHSRKFGEHDDLVTALCEYSANSALNLLPMP